MANCRLHMPGNRECPMPAVYRVRVNDRGHNYYRDVCVPHLTQAVDGGLSDRPIVTVEMLGGPDHGVPSDSYGRHG